MNKILDHFWQRCRLEYLMDLQANHWLAKRVPGTKDISVGDIVVIYSDQTQQGFWNLGRWRKCSLGEMDKPGGSHCQSTHWGEVLQSVKMFCTTSLPLEINCQVERNQQSSDSDGTPGHLRVMQKHL